MMWSPLLPLSSLSPHLIEVNELSADRALLEIASGAAGLTLEVDPGMRELYRGEFDDRWPDVRVEGSRVRLRFRFSWADWVEHAFGAGWASGRIALNAALP